MAAAKFDPTDRFRRSMLAKVHLGAKEMGLDEETRRDVIEAATGQRSARDLDLKGLEKVLDAYELRGWTPKKIDGGRAGSSNFNHRKRADNPIANKARALWLSLYHLGVVEKPSEQALEAFGKRQLGVDKLEWADQQKGYRLVEALKAMADRAGWNQDLTGVSKIMVTEVLQCRLIGRQCEILGIDRRDAGLTDGHLNFKTAGQRNEIAAGLGDQIRARRNG